MSEATKTCNLTEDEIEHLMNWYGYKGSVADNIDRINYLNKRLKAFKEVEVTETKSSGLGTSDWGTANG